MLVHEAQIMPEWEHEQQLQDPEVFPGLPSNSQSSLSWVFSRVCSWRVMPGTPPGAIQGASMTEPKVTARLFPRDWTTYGTTTTWLLAQKSSSKMLLRFRSERLFLPITPLQYHCCCPNEPKVSQQNDGGWPPAPSRCLQIGRGRCVAGGPVVRERPTWRDKTLSFTGENVGQVQRRRDCSLS